jgi:hypothetical protein
MNITRDLVGYLIGSWISGPEISWILNVRANEMAAKRCAVLPSHTGTFLIFLAIKIAASTECI